jgi:transposase InsO family protein
MPFRDLTKMHQRRQMALDVLEGRLSESAAARSYGVSRNTVRLWVGRAREEGVGEMAARSTRPKHSPRRTDEEIVREVLSAKALHPTFGARKIAWHLWEGSPPVDERTVERILSRHGLTRKAKAEEPAPLRFERRGCNELWQMDFKGLGTPHPGYFPLSVLDDRSRFALSFEPLADKRVDTVFAWLWELFGERGLPEAILSDHEPCFASHHASGPSGVEARLWRLGIRTPHGRPRHPQTQGKVERFHRTAGEWLGGALRPETAREARRDYARFLAHYNWERPHEALGMAVPGSVYVPSPRKRPERLPEHEIPEGAESRKVDAFGRIWFQGKGRYVGAGLVGERVVLRRAEGRLQIAYAGRTFLEIEA